MSKRAILLAAYWLVGFVLMPTEVAWAYIDPATTTYIIQIAAAIVITLGVSLGIFLYKLQIIVTNIKVTVHALFRRVGRRHHDSGAVGAFAQQASAAVIDEEDALMMGILDYPVPVRETYGALGEGLAVETPYDPKPASAQDAPARGRLQALGCWLWEDERSLKSRLLTASLVAAAASVTFVIFGMLDSVLQNETKLGFSFGEIVGPVMLLGLAAFAVVLGVLAVLKGRVFNFLVCLVLSTLICGYLQSTFFNAGIGKLVGLPLGWNELGIAAVLTNLVLWGAVFALVFFIGFSTKPQLRKLFGRLSRFAPALIVSVQLIALLSILPPAESWHVNQTSGSLPTLTEKGLFDVSPSKNVMVFVLDMFDEEFVENIVAEDPTYFDGLDGFTRYTNNLSVYNSTFPSVAHMMTDIPLDPQMMSAQYLDEAYRSQCFVADIREQGFGCNLYMERSYTYSDGATLEGIADNLEVTVYSFDAGFALERLARLSLLKSMPLALKATFWIHPWDLSDPRAGVKAGGADPFVADDVEFYHELKDRKLRLVEEPGHFTYYHLNGSHYPWYMNAEVEYVDEGSTTGEEQTKGCFRILDEYFRQMKERGIYEDATIIITGDHPTHMMDQKLDKPMLVGLFVKPSGAQGMPLQVSDAPVSIENIRATCVEAAGGDPKPWGRTYFEVGEDEDVVRDYYNRHTAEDARTHYISHYRIEGDARDWENWRLVESIPYDSRYWF